MACGVTEVNCFEKTEPIWLRLFFWGGVWRLVMGGYCSIIDFSKNEICGIIVGVSGPVAQLVRARAS